MFNQSDSAIHKKEAVLSAVEAENKLKEAYQKINLISNQVAKNNKIAKYWPSKAIAAPFLQDLSFAQLVTIKVQDVIKQHSFTDKKLFALLEAIDNFEANSKKSKGLFSKLFNKIFLAIRIKK